MRDLEITTTEIAGLDRTAAEQWTEAAGGTIETGTFAEFEMAEEVVGLLTLADGTFEVGVGECLRPYLRYYRGDDRREAEATFWKTVADHAGLF